ncbi:unnamed protein product [Oppiella nova]|uniref:alpha-1,2-Mannosidase n=1 Tax=Oppiella nova TaxID=334625 RepID=A0A7R9M3M3_9ACAR|nr:unnamed protein product [Oppiella nova]CAG2170047.1 unnamed protein product [Oppiella nova]
MDEVQKRLVRTTKGPLKLTFIGEIQRAGSYTSSDIHPKMDHLVCFLSGTLALGYYHEVMKAPKIHGHSVAEDSPFNEHLVLAEKLGRTCHYMYNLTKTGLSPEIAYFDETGNDDELQIRPADAHNLLRPEFVESLFYLYHITGKPIYRTWGWQIFKAFNKYSRVKSGGYTSIDDVRNPDNVRPKDMMESFWFAETLKYLYLLFCDDKHVVNQLLDKYVINTEGHVIPVRV